MHLCTNTHTSTHIGVQAEQCTERFTERCTERFTGCSGLMMRGTGFDGLGFSGPGVVSFGLELRTSTALFPAPGGCQLTKYTTDDNTGSYAFDVVRDPGGATVSSNNLLPKTTAVRTQDFVGNVTLFQDDNLIFRASSSWTHASDTQGYIKSIIMSCWYPAPPAPPPPRPPPAPPPKPPAPVSACPCGVCPVTIKNSTVER